MDAIALTQALVYAIGIDAMQHNVRKRDPGPWGVHLNRTWPFSPVLLKYYYSAPQDSGDEFAKLPALTRIVLQRNATRILAAVILFQFGWAHSSASHRGAGSASALLERYVPIHVFDPFPPSPEETP